MREIKISQETASRWYNGTDSELKELALTTYPELAVKELPKTWEELGRVDGWYVKGATCVIGQHSASAREYDKNIFATEEQASASIAIAQLSQLMAVYNDGWVADWTKGSDKYAIYYHKNKAIIGSLIYVGSFLTFKNRKTAELFLENFSSLIQTAKPLL